jgi:RNA polymerase sigma-54 factor
MQQTHKIGLSQKTVFSARLDASLRVLSASQQELEALLGDYALMNPLIEVVPPYRTGRGAASGGIPPEVKSAGTASLDTYLLEQISFLNYKGAHLKALHLIVSSLDENGFFRGSVRAIAENAGLPAEEARTLLREVKKLDPPGIGAKDFRESILIQLKAKGLLSGDAATVVRCYLDFLAREDFAHIEKAAGIGAGYSKDLLRQIRKLNPYPAKAFQESPAVYIEPDIVIRSEGGNVTASLNPEAVYRVRSAESIRLPGHEALSEEESAYVSKLYGEAKWLEKSLQRRYETLLELAGSIARLQRGFFLYGSGYMAPLSKKDIALSLCMHPSTVTRALSGKYILSAQGVHPASFFFSGGSKFRPDVSPLQVKAYIKNIVANENACFPESDGKIAACLGAAGIEISRRTVAKYRLSLGISPASIRRRR